LGEAEHAAADGTVLGTAQFAPSIGGRTEIDNKPAQGIGLPEFRDAAAVQNS
jgi:hypothetical protein